MQKCFVDGTDKSIHSLAVKGGRDIVAGINKLQDKFELVVATKDWHPKNHGSFASQYDDKNPFEMIVLKGIDQMLWPDHCVQNTKGADYIKGLNTKKIKHVTYKGTDPAVDSYSGFLNNNKTTMTDLDQYLKKQGVKEIYVVGLAADYCVKATAVDGAQLGYKTFFVKDLNKAVDASKDNMKKVYSALKAAKANIVSAKDVK